MAAGEAVAAGEAAGVAVAAAWPCTLHPTKRQHPQPPLLPFSVLLPPLIEIESEQCVMVNGGAVIIREARLGG